jgi:uncharacterized protein (TIGR01244 family)
MLRWMNGRETAGAVRAGSAALLVAVMTLFAGSYAWTAESAVDASDSAYSEYLSQVEGNVVLAGALDLDQLRASHQGAIRVVDLRTEGEGAPEEAAAAETLGISYTNIPVSSAAIDAAQVSALREALAAAGADDLVVVHCRTGNRAGLLYGAAQLEAGVPLDEVKESVSGIVTSAPINEGLESYAKKLDAGL